MADIVIRPVGKQDAPVLVDILRSSFEPVARRFGFTREKSSSLLELW